MGHAAPVVSAALATSVRPILGAHWRLFFFGLSPFASASSDISISIRMALTRVRHALLTPAPSVDSFDQFIRQDEVHLLDLANCAWAMGHGTMIGIVVFIYMLWHLPAVCFLARRY